MNSEISNEKSIEEEGIIEDFSSDFRITEIEKRKTKHTEMANKIALLIIGFYVVSKFLFFVNYPPGINSQTSSLQLEKLEMLVFIIVGFYFGQKLPD